MKVLKKIYSIFNLNFSLLTFSFILFPISFISAQHMAIEWQQCFGGVSWEYCSDIVNLEDGYLILGSTNSTDGDISNNHGGLDLWLVKTNDQGLFLWEKCYGGSHGDGGVRIFPTENNSFYLLGDVYSSDGDISNDPYPESTDYWIVKIDNSGNILWDKIVGGNRLDQIWTGTATSDGGVVAFGWTGSTDGDVSTYYGYYDMWLIKLNSEGEVVWDQTLGNSYFDWGQAIIETGDKGFLVGGSSHFAEGGNLFCDSYHGGLDAALIKLDSLGNIEWQQCYGGSYDESFTAMLETEDGYILAAYTTSNDGDVSGWHPGYDHLGNPEADIWVVKTDIYGTLLWQQCLGGSDDDECQSIMQTNDGDFILFGVTQSNDGDVSGNHTVSEYSHDIWMVKLSSEGELLWQQCIGGAGDEIVNFGVIQKSDTRYVIAGQSDWASDDVECDIHHQSGGPWYPDFWVFELRDCAAEFPAVPSSPCGPDTLCTADGLPAEYITLPADWAQTYEWFMTPETAGTITGDSLSGTVTWSPAFSGTAAIAVRSINDCGTSEWSAPHYTQVIPLHDPVVPQVPAGPDTVCTAGDITTIYTTSAADYAMWYEWLLTPQEAGTIIGDSLLGTVSWSQNFEQTQVYTCLGTEETEAEDMVLRVYPNPTREYIIFELSVVPGKNRTYVKLYDIYGQLVARTSVKKGKNIMSTASLSKGLLIYELTINGKIYSGKVMVRK